MHSASPSLLDVEEVRSSILLAPTSMDASSERPGSLRKTRKRPAVSSNATRCLARHHDATLRQGPGLYRSGARWGRVGRCEPAGLRSHRRGQGFESPQLHQQERFPCSRSQRRSPELQRALRGGGLLVDPEVPPRDQPYSSRVLTATSMGGAAPGIHETPSSRKPRVARREVRTAGRAAGRCLRSLASAARSTPARRSR
jgi:hypothetical protein